MVSAEPLVNDPFAGSPAETLLRLVLRETFTRLWQQLLRLQTGEVKTDANPLFQILDYNK